MPISSKCLICTHPQVELINEQLRAEVDYKTIIKMIEDMDGTLLTPSSISRHYKNHFAPDNIKALVWKNGALCFTDGTPVTPVSGISFLEGIISLAAKGITDHPEKIGPRDGLIAVELLIKIRSGLDKQDEFEEAWTDFIKTGKHKVKKTRKITLEETTEESPAALPAPIVYEGFEEDEEVDA